MQAEGVVNIWAHEGRGNRGVKELHNEELNNLYSSSKYRSGGKIENEMGGACSAYGGEARRIQGFGGET